MLVEACCPLGEGDWLGMRRRYTAALMSSNIYSE